MPDLESVVLELDPRSVQKAIVQSNKDVEDWEKGVVGAGERMQKSLERMGEMLIKMNDRSYNSMERLTQSIERQAAAYGKTRVEHLIADRDRFIKKLGDEQGMIERVTKAYQRMIEVEEQRPPGGGEGGSGGTGFNMRYAFFGVKDIMEGRTKFALAEAANEMMRLRGAALAVGGTVAGITALGFAIYELKKYTEEAAEAPYKLAAAFEELRAPLKQANDELRLTNDRLRNQIATLEHRAPNKLAEMLDEASIAADKLATFLEKDSRALTKLLSEQRVGAMAQFLGEAGIDDIRKMFGGITGYGGHDAEIARINREFQAKVDAARKAKDLKSADAAVEEWKKQLEPLRKQETDTLNKALADSRQAQYRRDIASAFNIGDPYQIGALASRILGGQDQTKRREIIEYVQGQLQERWTHIDEQIENTRLERRKQEIAPPKGQNEFESALAHRRESVKSYQAELDALRRAQADKELSDFGQFEADIAKLEAASKNEVAENHRKYAAMGAKQLAQLDAATKQDYSLQIAIAYTKEHQKQSDELKKQADLWRHRGAELDRSLNKTFDDEVNAGLKKNQKAAEDIIKSGKDVDAARRAHAGRMSMDHEQFAARVIRMQAGRTPEDQARADMMAAAVEMAGERERIEKQIAEIQADGVKTLGEKSKEIAELRMTEEERLQRFQEEGALHLMELEKQRFDQVSKTAQELAHTLFTNPQGFAKQLETTLRDAALRPIEKGIGDLIAGILVGKHLPQDVISATNSNTQATVDNTAVMRDVAHVLAGLHFRADGGPLHRGDVSIVGEKGVELFVADQDGQVVPNLDLSALLKAYLKGKVGTPPIGPGFSADDETAILKGAAHVLEAGGPFLGLAGVAPTALGVLADRMTTPDDPKAIHLGMIPNRKNIREFAEEVARWREAYRVTAGEPQATAIHEAHAFYTVRHPRLQRLAGVEAKELPEGMSGGYSPETEMISVAKTHERGTYASESVASTLGHEFTHAMQGARRPEMFIDYPDLPTEVERANMSPVEFNRRFREYYHHPSEVEARRGGETVRKEYQRYMNLFEALPPEDFDNYYNWTWKKVPKFAQGGIITQPTVGMLAEAGPEAVIPLKNAISSTFGNTQQLAYSMDRNTVAIGNLTAVLTAFASAGGFTKAAQSATISTVSAGSTADYRLPSGLINRTGETIGGAPSIPIATPPFVGGGAAPDIGGGDYSPQQQGGGWLNQVLGTVGRIFQGGGSTGGSRAAGGGGLGGFGGMVGNLGNWSALKQNLGIGQQFPPIGTIDRTPAGVDDAAGVAGAGTTSFGSVLGSPIAGMGGMMLAQYGLLGSHAGTAGGIAMGAAGGALLGFQYGGPIGAAIGGLAGLGAGIGEMLAGVETPENEAKRLVKSYYHVSIDTQMAKQIVQIAQQKYANHVSIAVRSPEVRQMLGLYAAGTSQSQKSLLSSMTPHGGSLVEQGGRLYQEATYQYGQPYAFQSKLPIYGGVSPAGYYPSPSPSSGTMLMQVSVDGKGSGDYMAGNVFTANYVQDRWSEAAGASDGRVGNSAVINDPGLIVT